MRDATLEVLTAGCTVSANSEEFKRVGNMCIPGFFERFFNSLDQTVLQVFYLAASATDDVVMVHSTYALVFKSDGSVAEVTTAHDSSVLEGVDAPVNSDPVNFELFDLLRQFVFREWFLVSDENIEDRHSRFSDF